MSGQLVLLDTSAVLNLYRGKATGMALKKALDPMLGGDRPLVSIVTLGEAISFAKQRKWGLLEIQRLRDRLAQCVVVPVTDAALVERYSDIDRWCVKNGKSVGDNDVWIAATAGWLDAILVTNDDDFSPIPAEFVKAAYFDQAGVRQPTASFP